MEFAKTTRLLSMYERLLAGNCLNKQAEAMRFAVDDRTIQRDMGDIRVYLADMDVRSIRLEYDRKQKGYVLKQIHYLTKEEILVVTKILLEGRGLTGNELKTLVKKLVALASPEDQKLLQDMTQNEVFHYQQLVHNKALITAIWEFSEAIRSKRYVTISYKKEHSLMLTERVLKPVGLIFSEFYFYVIAYLHSYDFKAPTVYRLDRIETYRLQEDRFKFTEKDRFEEGEFRKRIQFMNSGDLIRIVFRFWGPSPEAVLDRLPTARIVEKTEQGVTLEAEVFGKGIQMWLLSQGPFVEVLEPESLRDSMQQTLQAMVAVYGPTSLDKVK